MKKLESIIHYVDNEMTQEDRILFEKELSENIDLQRHLELAEEMQTIFSDEDLFQFSEKLQQVNDNYISKEQIKKEREPILSKIKNNWNLSIGWNIMTLAATFVLILSTFFLIRFISNPSPNAVYDQYYTKYDANILTRSAESGNNILVNAIQLYDKGNYSAAIQKFLSIIHSDEFNTTARFFLGVSYMETKDFQKAIENLSMVIKYQDAAFTEHAQWYLALCYIKSGQKTQAMTLLTKISSSDNFYKIMALDVIKKLK